MHLLQYLPYHRRSIIFPFFIFLTILVFSSCQSSDDLMIEKENFQSSLILDRHDIITKEGDSIHFSFQLSPALPFDLPIDIDYSSAVGKSGSMDDFKSTWVCRSGNHSLEQKLFSPRIQFPKGNESMRMSMKIEVDELVEGTEQLFFYFRPLHLNGVLLYHPPLRLRIIILDQN